MAINPDFEEKPIVQPTMALPSYIAKQKRNKLILLAILVGILVFLAFMFGRSYFTKEEPLPTVDTIKKGKILPPNFNTVITGNTNNKTKNLKTSLYKPLGVAIHPNGNIYATSFSLGKIGRGKVEVFKPNGDYLFSFNKIDNGDELRSPTYIAINSKGDVYVSDKRHRAIFVFASNGKFKKRFLPNNDASYKWIPLALAFDKKDNLYVTDVYAQHQVLVFRSNGELLLKFGSTAAAMRKGENPGKFYYPNGIFIDKDDKIFVADSNNRRVQVFSPKGKLLYMIETGGLPRGIAIDSKNQLYVVDALGHDISVFKKNDKDAQPLTIFGEQGVDFGQFLYPNGIAVDQSGKKIIVTDRENNRLQVFVWPTIAAAVSEPTKKALPGLTVLSAAAVFALILFMRKRKYFVSATFLDKVLASKKLLELSKVGKTLYMHPKAYEVIKNYREGDLEIQDFIRPAKADPIAVENMKLNHNLNEEAAYLFAAATRGLFKTRILTEDIQSHKVAAKLNLETMDYELFKEYFLDY